MARKQLSDLDLVQNQLLNAVLQNLAAAPSSPKNGQVWFDTTLGKIVFRTAGGNVDPTARASHTGTQTANTISDFDTQVRTSRLDQMAPPQNHISLNTKKITGLEPGTAATDAVNRGQLDAVSAGVTTTRLDQLAAPTAAVNLNNQKITALAAATGPTEAVNFAQLQAVANGTDWKESVRAATTGNIALTGLQTIDGISVVAGNRVLVKNQTTGNQNGIYVVATGAWTRAADATTGTLTAGTALFVEEGTTQADTQWRLTTNDPITVNTTALDFAQIGAAVSYTAGVGVTLTGNAFSTDNTVVVRKAAFTIGDGSALAYPVTHNLGTADVTVGVFYVADGAEVDCDKVRTNANVVTLGFAAAPAAGALRVVVHG